MSDRRQVTPKDVVDKWAGRIILFGSGALFVFTIAQLGGL